MKLNYIRTIFLWILLALNVLAVAGLLIAGFGYLFSPVAHHKLAIASLFMPVFIFANIGFCILWLFFKKKYSLVSGIALLISIVPIRTYVPINILSDIPTDGIKVLTYNSLSFGINSEAGTKECDGVAKYLIEQNADIVCLQEANNGGVSEEYMSKLLEAYPYQETDRKPSQNSVMLLSHYPILKSERIEYESTGNLSTAFWVKINNDTVIVINNHLQTNSFSQEDKKQIKKIVSGEMENKAERAKSISILSKYGEAAAKRAKQADAVAEFMNRHKGQRMIVCGDFNDTPVSYTHNIICRDLKDCFVRSGCGFGWTYAHNGIRVRIDNIMCSDHFDPILCKVDSKQLFSDHFPVIAWLKISTKP